MTPARTDGHVRDPDAPHPSERVGDDDRDVHVAASLDLGAESSRRAIGIIGQQDGRAVVGIGEVDAGVGVDEAVMGLGDAQGTATAQDPRDSFR